MIDEVRVKFEGMSETHRDSNIVGVLSPGGSDLQTMGETASTNFMTVPVKSHAFKVSAYKP